MLHKTGVPLESDLLPVIPSAERRAKGPVAVVECFQNIPCNPCYTSCNQGAMKELIDINDLPEVNFTKCNGCGLCVSKCPGLAIFIIDESYSDTEAIVRIPYEFLPLPKQGDIVDGVGRDGEVVCKAEVTRVQNAPSMDRTPVLWLKVPKEHSMTVRCIRMESVPTVEATPDSADDNDSYICRCEGLTRGELLKYLEMGLTTLDELKRVTRAGMGPCQGRTCRQLIMNEIARFTGQKPAEMPMTTFRPPVKPIKFGMVLDSKKEAEGIE